MSFYMCMQCTKLQYHIWSTETPRVQSLCLERVGPPKPEVGSICFCFFVLTCAYYLLTSKAVGLRGDVFWATYTLGGPRLHLHHRSIIFMLHILILIVIVIVRVFIITPPQSLIIIIGLHWIITHHELWASSSSSLSAVGSNLCFFNSLVHLVRLVCRCPFGELAAGFWAIGNVNNWNTMWQFGINGLFCAFLHLCIHSSVYPRLTYLLQLFMVQVTAKASVLFTTSCAFGMLILGLSVHCQEMLFELKGRK